jgi:hypothetical protein
MTRAVVNEEVQPEGVTAGRRADHPLLLRQCGPFFVVNDPPPPRLVLTIS